MTSAADSYEFGFNPSDAPDPEKAAEDFLDELERRVAAGDIVEGRLPDGLEPPFKEAMRDHNVIPTEPRRTEASSLDLRASKIAEAEHAGEAPHRMAFLMAALRGAQDRDQVNAAWSVLEHDAEVVFREGPERSFFHACSRALGREEAINLHLFQQEVLEDGVTQEAWDDWCGRVKHVPSVEGDLVVHARTILVRTLERNLNELGAELAQSSAAKRPVVLERIDQLRERIEAERGRQRESYDLSRDMDEVLPTLFDAEHCPKIPSGIAWMDEFTGGLPLGYPTIIGARPAQGKTAMGVDLICEAAGRGDLVYVLSVELDRRALLLRMIASTAPVDHGLLTADPNVMQDEDAMALALSTAQQIRSWSVAIEAPSSAGVGRVLADVRRAEADYGKPVKLVVIDHAHALDPSPSARRSPSRTDELEQISGEVRKLAKQLPGAATVLLWQLNRDSPKQRRAPSMSDLKGSGASEQDADSIWLLHRQTDDQPSDPDEAPSQVVVAKNRSGPTGRVPLPFCGPAMTWRRGPLAVTNLRMAGAAEALDEHETDDDWRTHAHP